VYTCIHINYNQRIQRVTENYTVQQNNFDIWFKISIVAEQIGLLSSHVN
jgi:hypothetical protein